MLLGIRGLGQKYLPERRNSEFLIAHVAPCCEVMVAVGVLYPIGKEARKSPHRGRGSKCGFTLFLWGKSRFLDGRSGRRWLTMWDTFDVVITG